MYQTEVICLNDLVVENHQYRKFIGIWSFTNAEAILAKCEKANNNKGFGILKIFKCLLLQFMENLSDRELERYVQDSNAAKWFCGFNISEATPDFTVFSKARKRIGTNVLSMVFDDLRSQLQGKGLMSEVFTFIDATHLIAKANLWEERDKVIATKYEKLNNESLPKVAHDNQARIGAKSKNKFWYGYKQHTAVDMQSGLINKIAITPANVTDAYGMRHVTPKSGAIYADKGYCTKPCQIVAKAKGLHLAAIKNNNMKTKNKDLDKYYSQIRAPFEHVFSQRERRTRYVGIAKNQFSAFMGAICFNLKRILVLNIPDLHLA